MKVAVVGGAGYIGSHVVLELKEAGHEPIIFDNLSSGSDENISCTRVPFFKGDIRNPQDLDEFFRAYPHIDGVIHLAALKAAGQSMTEPEIFSETNVKGSINLVNAMVKHEVKTIIFSSSATVYGDPQYLPLDEEHPKQIINYYGFTKLQIEQMLEWYGKIHSMKFINLRYFNAAGYDPKGRITGLEKNPANLFPVLLEAATGKREGITVHGTDYETPDGTGVRDYIHVTDLADAHVKALEYLHAGGESGAFNLGTGKGASVQECIDISQEVVGKYPVTLGPRRPGDCAACYADASKARKLLNWEPKHSDLRSIVESMARIYKAKEKLNAPLVQ